MEKTYTSFCLLILALLFYTPAKAEWESDTISFGEHNDRSEENGLAVGPDNTYHKVFVRDYLTGDYEEDVLPFNIYYSFKEPGKSWSEPELIGQATEHELAPNIIVTDDGRVVVSFLQDTKEGYWRDKIFVAEKTDDGWVYEEIPTICDSVNRKPYMAMDSNGYIHITWVSLKAGQYYEDGFEGGGRDYRIAYSTNLSGQWETQLIENSQIGNYGMGARPKIEVCSDGVAHILYRGGNYSWEGKEQHHSSFIDRKYRELIKGNDFESSRTLSPERKIADMIGAGRKEHAFNNYRMHYATNLQPGGDFWEIDILESYMFYDENGTIKYDQSNGTIHVLAGGSNDYELPDYVHYFSKKSPSDAWSEPIQVNDMAFGTPIGIVKDEKDKIYAFFFEKVNQMNTGTIYMVEKTENGFDQSEFFSEEQLFFPVLTSDLLGEFLLAYSVFRYEIEGGEVVDSSLDVFMKRTGQHQWYDPTAIEGNSCHSQISVYPNPAGNYVTLELDIHSFSDNTVVKLFNNEGREVHGGHLTVNPGKKIATFDTSGLESGMYFLVLETGEFVKNTKFFVY